MIMEHVGYIAHRSWPWPRGPSKKEHSANSASWNGTKAALYKGLI